MQDFEAGCCENICTDSNTSRQLTASRCSG